MEPTVTPLPPDEQTNRPSSSELSERELDVLRLVATGAGNKEIAQQLFISPNTVKVHLRNIFSKIGVASRTEAAMYAARKGLVAVPSSAAPENADTPAPPSDPEAAPAFALEPTDTPSSTAPRQRRLWWVSGVVVAVVLLGVAGLWSAVRPRPMPTPTPSASPAPPRWQTLADMPTSRSDLAATVYDDQIYAIGGESAQGITGVTERYNPPTNSWEALAVKPVPVSNAGAAVIAGQIYVPGGQSASGQITSTFEVYSPRDNGWQQLPPLPATLSRYALAAFEGQLYVFGGWDGEKYRATVYRYDPDTGKWTELTPMPTARGNAGAAVAGGRIYVIGGSNSAGPVTTNEVYTPEQEGQSGGSPWQTRAPFPEARSRLQAAVIADNIYVAGSLDQAGLSAFGYLPPTNSWQALQAPPAFSGTGAALVALDRSLHLLGGKELNTPSARHLAYQALFSVFIPIVR
jgi:DNA-binding CsgD family transcriptional regulator/N-acetylneuraminic acid mutarotase